MALWSRNERELLMEFWMPSRSFALIAKDMNRAAQERSLNTRDFDSLIVSGYVRRLPAFETEKMLAASQMGQPNPGMAVTQLDKQVESIMRDVLLDMVEDFKFSDLAKKMNSALQSQKVEHVPFNSRNVKAHYVMFFGEEAANHRDRNPGQVTAGGDQGDRPGEGESSVSAGKSATETAKRGYLTWAEMI